MKNKIEIIEESIEKFEQEIMILKNCISSLRVELLKEETNQIKNQGT